MTEPAADLKYTAEHEWVAVDGDVATVGITANQGLFGHGSSVIVAR